MSALENLIAQLESTTVKAKEKEVSFAGRALKLDNEEDAQEIVNAIKETPDMTTLNLEGNTIGIPAAKAIAKALENQHEFRRALWRDMFTRRTENEIPKALNFLSNGIMLANAHLVELNLSDNAFGPRGLIGIVKLLESPSCYTLQELHLNNNGLGIAGGKMLSNALCNCIKNSQKDGKLFSLKVFVCGRNRLENEGATAISQFLKEIKTLESLAMPQNGIYHPGIKELADALCNNPNMKAINLEDNSLTEEGAKAIGKTFPFLRKLELLNLGDCLIRTKGAFAIANSLKNYCSYLRELNLGYNEIKKEGGIAIIEAIENKESLDSLILNGNQFGYDGCDIIKEKMANINKADQLGTLSEDEGEADEDEEEDNEENDAKDEETEKEEDDLISSGDHITSIKNQMLELNFDDNFMNLTEEKLAQFDKAKVDLVFPKNADHSYFLNLFIKLSSIIKPDNEKLISIAYKFTDIILAKAFGFFTSENIASFNNDFSVSLGFLKGEDKKMQSIDITGALILLEHAVRQPYFPQATRNELQFFLSRPLKYATACGKTKHVLMQTLYQV